MVAQARVIAEGSMRNRVVRTYVEVELTGLLTGKVGVKRKIWTTQELLVVVPFANMLMAGG